jgi:hypothetical protein
MKKILLSLGIWLLTLPSYAVAPCMMCTAAVAVGVETARWLGVDDMITGIWVGAFVLMLIFWVIHFLKRRGVENGLWYLAVFALFYGFLSLLYFMPTIPVDYRLLVGIITGTVVLWLAKAKLSSKIRANGGKSQYPFQKVIFPVTYLLVVSIIFAMFIYVI